MEIKWLEVLVMPNKEMLCNGVTLGFADQKRLGKFLKTAEEIKEMVDKHEKEEIDEK